MNDELASEVDRERALLALSGEWSDALTDLAMRLAAANTQDELASVGAIVLLQGHPHKVLSETAFRLRMTEYVAQRMAAERSDTGERLRERIATVLEGIIQALGVPQTT